MIRSEAFPSKYLRTADVPEGGKLFKISKIEQELVGQDKKSKCVLYLKGQEKTLVLNGTNWDAIAAFCGGDSDEWSGKDIVLFATQTPYQGKMVDCIRVRRPRPAASTKTRQPEPPPAEEDGDPGFDADNAIEVEDYAV